MMTHNLTNVDDVEVELFGCVFSPARRRGPVPAGRCRPEDMYSSSVSASVRTLADVGASVGGFGDANVSRSVSNTSVEERLPTNKKRRGSGMSIAGSIPSNGSEIYQHLTETDMSRASSTHSFNVQHGNNCTPQILKPPFDPCIAVMQQRVLSNSRFIGMNIFPSLSSSSVTNINEIAGDGCISAGVGAGRQHLQDVMATAQNSTQQQLAYVQQLQLRLKLQAQEKRQAPNADLLTGSMTVDRDSDSLDYTTNGLLIREDHDIFRTTPEMVRQRQTDYDHPDIQKYLPLLHPTNPFGMHLRACYTLAFGGLLGLPPIPTDQEYCRQFGPSFDPSLLPTFDVAALHAARFAELAMGALTCIKHREMTLLVALINASVLCLRNCADEKVHPSLMMDVARAYFFHAILRVHLDDMKRYFEYRRICLEKLAQLDVSDSRVCQFRITCSVHACGSYQNM
jgi:hypothetical protein